ncbi:acrosomal protein KIAA1210 homolog [Python bivittatus]|uniref:Acrosomal protein KIAA1210 homolog n=1 Tax=Python bivittatus TaxID=176946 RepID=A0A9F2QZY5_PYTBI|nr:acrosomal protein KIAA1210 homolog [Python bivittatus]
MAGFYNCLKSNKDCITMTTSEEQPEALEGEETGDAFSRKKKSKFQTFKDFFAKKKKSKELPSPTEETKLKPSQSNSDISPPNLDSILLHWPAGTESNGSMGNQALSHDSLFLPEALCDVAGEAPSQENFPGKVKNFQLQQNLCLESPPVVITGKRMEDGATVSEDGGLTRSSLEISTLHDVLTISTTQVSNPVQHCSSLSLEETDSEGDQVVSESPSKHLSSLRPGSPASLLCHALPVDFDTPASPLGCLDTSAARHRIAMNPRKQKGLAKKSHPLPVEQMLQEQHLLEPDEGKTSDSKFLEEAAGQKKDWEGMLSRYAVNLNEDWTDNASPVTRTSEALPYSCSAGLHVDGTCVLISETQNLPETELQVSITKPCPSVPSSLINCKEGDKVEHEEMKGTWAPTDDQKPQSGPEVTENSESFHLKAKAIGLHRASPSALLENNVGKELEAEGIQIACSQRTDDRANVTKPARNRARACDRSVCGDTSVSLEADPVLYVPQLSSSALKVSSDAPKDLVHKNSLTVKEVGRRPSDMELQLSQGPVKPTDCFQGALSTLKVDPDRPMLLSAAGKKPYLLPELSCSVLSSSVRKPEDNTVQESGSLSSGRPSTVGSTEVASKTCPPVSSPVGVQLGNVITKEESKATEEMIKTQTKSTPAKPVRFTVAPAWQRSLSGGSSSVDNSCPRNSPTSPIRPELFEGISPLEAMSQISILNSPERLDRGDRNMAANLNSSTEEVQSCESPFGVKLRRTSSLLKYQTEHHRDPPKLVPLAASPPSSVKVEAKAPSSATSLQNLTTGAKGLVANSGTQEKNLLKAKPEGEGGTKQQASKPSEQIPVSLLGGPSFQPTWISVTKLKQQGFQGNAFAKGQKKKEEAVAKTQKEEVKLTSVSPLEKQVTLTSDNSPKKSGLHQHVRLLESKVPLKSAALAAKDGAVRIPPQEGPRVEKDPRSAPILPVASCSPTEPPWLSLAKKKAKAWSEMPQTVQ